MVTTFIDPQKNQKLKFVSQQIKIIIEDILYEIGTYVAVYSDAGQFLEQFGSTLTEEKFHKQLRKNLLKSNINYIEDESSFITTKQTKSKKTISINDFLKESNELLANSDISEPEKSGICLLTEKILNITFNYNGFSFFDWENGGKEKWQQDNQPESTQPYIGRFYTRIYHSKI